MKSIKLAIFDMDGLLIDSERGMWVVNEEKALNELSYPFSIDFAKTLMGASYDISKQRLVNHYGKDFPVEKFYEIVFKLNAEMINNNEIKLMKGTKELLEFLYNNNIKCCVATSSLKHTADPILKNLDIRKYFEYVVTGEDITNGKPAPDIYLKALGNINKEEAIIFEDAHNGARAAINAEIDLILVPCIAELTEDDYKDAYKVINSLDEAIDIIKERNNIR